VRYSVNDILGFVPNIYFFLFFLFLPPDRMTSREAWDDKKWVSVMVVALLSAGADSFLLERMPLSFYSRSTAVAVPFCQKTPFLSPSLAHPLNFSSRRKYAGSRNAAIGGDVVAEGGERKLMSASVFDEWVQR